MPVTTRRQRATGVETPAPKPPAPKPRAETPAPEPRAESKREANARRQREYRARKRAELGDKAYLEGVAKYKRDLRARKAPVVPVPPDQPPVRVEPNVQVKVDDKTVNNLVKRLIEILNSKTDLAPRLPEIKAIVKAVPDVVERIKGQASCDDLKALIKARAVETGRDADKSTIKTQVDRLSTLYKAMTGKQFNCSDYSWTRDTGRVLNFIETNPRWDARDRSKQNTRNAFRTALASVLRDLEGYEGEQQIYSQYSTQVFKNKVEPSIGEGKLSKTQQRNYVPFERLLDARNFYKPGTQENAIVSVYTDMPPRRLQDFYLAKVIKKKNKNVTAKFLDSLKEDKDYNFVVLDKAGRPDHFIFNRYKTASSIGTQVIDIPVELSKTLKRYIQNTKINNGDYLFGNSNNEEYSNFGEVVSKIFKKAVGKKVSANLIRHAYVSYYLQRKRSVNERKKLAYLMGHDVHTQSLYEVIDDADED